METANSLKKVLLVEDDPFLQSLLAQRLAAKGYKLFSAKEGTEALAIAEREMPEVILLDILLPGMNGYEILEKLKTNAKTKTINVIMVSNLGQQSDIDKAIALGASKFFVKANVTPEEIISAVA
ncbi:MAG: response regulator [Patescibacteria group bacterium]